MVDLGTAKFNEKFEKDVYRRCNQHMPHYQIPPEIEQESGIIYSKEADVFALGRLIYELGTGQELFTERHHASYIDSVLHEKVFPIEYRDTQFSDLMLGCLNKDPTKRLTIEKVLAHPYLQVGFDAE